MLGVYQVHVNRSRVFNRLEDGVFGNLRKHNALGRFGLEFEGLVQVPRNGFSLSVLIRREPYHFGLGGGLLEFLDELFFVVCDDVFGFKPLVNIDAFTPFGQIANVAVAALHDEVFPQITFNGFCFCWGLDDD